MSLSRVWSCISICLGLICAQLSFANDQTASASRTSHVDPGTEVFFDFERGRITEPIPFDVPFFLLAPVPETARDPEGWWDDGEACGPKSGPSQPSPDTPDTDPPLSHRVRAAIVKVDQNGTKKTHFEATMPPLGPRRDYCFHFRFERERTEDEAARIRSQLVPALIRDYRTTDVDEIATLAGDTAFRKRIRDIVARSVAPATPRFEEGGYLDLERHPSFLDRRRFQFPLQNRLAFENHIERYRQILGEIRVQPGVTTRATLEQIAEELAMLQDRVESTDDEDLTSELVVASDTLRLAEEELTSFEEDVASLAEEIEVWLADEYDVIATTTQDYETRFSSYVSADLGIGVAPETDEFFNYIGANVYTRPINKKAPLAGLDFRKRFAFLVGLSDKISEDDREGLIDDRPVLLGGGLRLTDHLRLTAGAQLFRENDPDPLVDELDLAVTPFVSLSIDFDIAQTFENLFSPLLNGD